ncbi:MAG: extracellular solute-binding protein [Lachnospiraceae bacterium]|nr:extracellular solute-binding protein [Lachnospiraceae bacterium]
MKKSKIIHLVTLAAAFLLLCVILVLTGCHGAKKRLAFNVPEDFLDDKTYEITFWAKNDTNKTQLDIYKKAIEDFESYYPNIKVILKHYTDYRNIYNDVITNIATNTTPNVCISYPDHIATYMTGENVVLPLDALIDDTDYGLGGAKVKFDSVKKDEVIAKFLEEGKIGGVQYALPYMRSTEACYVNVDMVKKLGYELPETLTWDFIWEVSEAAMEKDADGYFKVNGQKVLIPFIYKSTDNMMIQVLKQLDAGYSTPEGDILLFNDQTKEFLYEVSKHAKTRSFSTFAISSYPGNYLNKGQCTFAVDSTAGATWMGSDAPLQDIHESKKVKFTTEVYPVPQFDPENPKMISQGPSVCIFNKEDPGEVLASWLFAQFLLTNDVQISYSQTEGYIPVTSKAHDTAEYQDYLSRAGEDTLHYDVKIKAAKLLLNNIDHTFVTPVFNGSASLRDAAGNLIEEVTKSTRRKATIDDAYMEKLYKDTAALYRLDQLRPAGPSNNEGEEGADTKDGLGPLPGAAKTLIVVLITSWILMGAFVIFKKVKKAGK